jgi:hypothetical protein
MRILAPCFKTHATRGHPRAAFTIPEVMVTVAVSMVVMAALVTTQLFGLRLFEFSKPKLCASDNAREAIGRLQSEVRSAVATHVGSANATNFSAAIEGGPLQGNALQIFGSTNTNSFAVYYWDAADGRLKRWTTPSRSIDVIANGVSNQNFSTFTIEAGVVTNGSPSVLTNDMGSRAIGLTLNFYQIEYPIIKIGTNRFYDTYFLRTRINQRVPQAPSS